MGLRRAPADHGAGDRSAAAELKPFFVKHRDEIVVRVVDPDIWRVAGWPENAHHFLDFGVPEYGKFPFTELPRDYDAALEKFGRATLERNGLLPWRLAEFFGQLRRGFEGFGRQSRLRDDRRRSCFPPSRPTTSRTPISRSTAPTTTTAS